MKKLLFFIASVFVLSIGAAQAEEANAVFFWINGSNTCYQLSQMPVISYDNGAAVLTIDGIEQLRVPAGSLEDLTITYGIYQAPTPTDIESSTAEDTKVHKVGKYIIGGRLIIVKDGQQFDAEGRKL